MTSRKVSIVELEVVADQQARRIAELELPPQPEAFVVPFRRFEIGRFDADVGELDHAKSYATLRPVEQYAERRLAPVGGERVGFLAGGGRELMRDEAVETKVPSRTSLKNKASMRRCVQPPRS